MYNLDLFDVIADKVLKFLKLIIVCLTLLQIDEICLLKLSLESIVTPKRTTYSLFKQQECCLKSEFP